MTVLIDDPKADAAMMRPYHLSNPELPRSIGSFMGVVKPSDFNIPAQPPELRTLANFYATCYVAVSSYALGRAQIFADASLSVTGQNAKLKALANEKLQPYATMKERFEALKTAIKAKEVENLSLETPPKGDARMIAREAQLVEMLLHMDRAARSAVYRQAITDKNVELLSAACNANPFHNLVTDVERKAINMALKTDAEIADLEKLWSAVRDVDGAIALSEGYLRSDSGIVGDGDPRDRMINYGA